MGFCSSGLEYCVEGYFGWKLMNESMVEIVFVKFVGVIGFL